MATRKSSMATSKSWVVMSKSRTPPGEFYFDKQDSKLYLYHNGTGAPPASATVVIPQKQVLVNATGSQVVALFTKPCHC